MDCWAVQCCLGAEILPVFDERITLKNLSISPRSFSYLLSILWRIVFSCLNIFINPLVPRNLSCEYFAETFVRGVFQAH
jgi:hypothetical protein